jgi:tRNA(His) 5'-end guanylyltransferase
MYTLKTLGEYQSSLERFENFNDGFILPDMRVIVRIDGRRVGEYWESRHMGEYPYVIEVHDALVECAKQLFNVGMQMDLAFVHGDEISVLLSGAESSNPRRRLKLGTLLCSAATLHCFSKCGLPLYFYAKVSELPSFTHVLDYFLWQRKCGERNLVSKVISDALSQQGQSKQQIDARMGKLTLEERAKLAAELGADIQALPKWQLRGSLMWPVAGEPGEIAGDANLTDNDEEYIVFLKRCLKDQPAAAIREDLAVKAPAATSTRFKVKSNATFFPKKKG